MVVICDLCSICFTGKSVLSSNIATLIWMRWRRGDPKMLPNSTSPRAKTAWPIFMKLGGKVKHGSYGLRAKCNGGDLLNPKVCSWVTWVRSRAVLWGVSQHRLSGKNRRMPSVRTGGVVNPSWGNWKQSCHPLCMWTPCAAHGTLGTQDWLTSQCPQASCVACTMEVHSWTLLGTTTFWTLRKNQFSFGADPWIYVYAPISCS